MWLSAINIYGWDLDGTLYPSSKELKQIVKTKQLEAVANQLNVGLVEAESKFKSMLAEIGSNTKTLDKLGINGTQFFLDIWDQIDLKKYINPDPKMVNLFENLAHKRHFIISNSNRVDQIETKLKLIGLNPNIFELIVDTVKIGKMKPSPQAFEAAISYFNVKPENLLYIGDRDETDIKGAKAVGLKTCMVWGTSPISDLSLATPYELANT